MSGTYLLDTSAAIARINQDSDAVQVMEQAEELFLPIVALGELFGGAEHSKRIQSNFSRIEQLAMECTIIACDLDTARLYGRISHQLRVKGRPIPQNDVWIAALAIQHNLTLLTRDAHFSEVDGLLLTGWQQ